MHTFLYGVAGGLAANLLRLFSFVKSGSSTRSALLGDTLYWIQFFLLPIISGFVASAYGPLPSLLAFHLGISTPALLKLAAGSVPHMENKVD